MSLRIPPFEIFKKAQSSVCIWLNGQPAAVERKGERIWNEAKYRMATDGALNEIQKRTDDVKWPDIICGDFDSVLELEKRKRNATVVHLPDQMKTDLTKAIELCLEKKTTENWKFERIVLLGGLNGRFDHTMATLSTLITFHEDVTPIFVLDSTNLVMSLPKGESQIDVDLNLTTKMCGVIPLAQTVTKVTSKGLKYEMGNLPLAFGQLISSSNEVTTETINIHSTAPLLFTIEINSE